VPGDTNGTWDIFVRDWWAGTTTRVNVSSDGGQQADDFSFGAAISADGRYVVFGSVASNLVPGDTNGTYDIFVRDLSTGTTSRADVSSDGTQANGGFYNYTVAISADGRYVAFGSVASNLVPDDTNGRQDIFVRDRWAGTTSRVSLASDGSQANGHSMSTAISGDGRWVAFGALASNLVPGDTNGSQDIFLRDRWAGSTSRVSVASDGTQANGASFGPAVSNNRGPVVAFGSVASNLVPDDTNNTADTFVRSTTHR
jgi:Periplasmic component of the Tol biopolymer transport system